MRSTSDILVEVKLGVENPLKTGVFLKNVVGDIKHNGAKFARVELVSSDTVAAKSNGVCKATFRIVIDDPMSLLAMGMNPKSWNLDDYKADAQIVLANTSSGSRKFRVKNYPLKALASKIK